MVAASATSSTLNTHTAVADARLTGADKKRPHFANPTPTGRQDVLALKQQLADALGENGPLYWDALRDFVMGKLNRQEFDFYANLYLSRENAYLHNAFILCTVHNAQASTPPPIRHRAVNWSKRRRGKDGLDADDDPLKKKLKANVMSLSRADRERLKALVKNGDKDKLQPLVDQLLGPRVSRPPPLPLPAEQLPTTFNTDYSRGLLAPLCSDLKELPSPTTLHARMTSIALENGLLGGLGEDVVNAMLFAMESYIKSAISNAIIKRRVNRCVGVKMITANDPPTSALASDDSPSPQPSVETLSSEMPPIDSIDLQDLSFSFQVSPYVLVENPLNAEKLSALISDSEDEMSDDGLGDTSSEGDFEL